MLISQKLRLIMVVLAALMMSYLWIHLNASSCQHTCLEFAQLQFITLMLECGKVLLRE